MVIKFESGETSLAPSLWEENILKYCSEMTLDPRLINEVNRDLKLGSELQLQKEYTLTITTWLILLSRQILRDH